MERYLDSRGYSKDAVLAILTVVAKQERALVGTQRGRACQSTRRKAAWAAGQRWSVTAARWEAAQSWENPRWKLPQRWASIRVPCIGCCPFPLIVDALQTGFQGRRCSSPGSPDQGRNDFMVRPDRFELPTFWFVARRSIQLSYGRRGLIIHSIACRRRFKFGSRAWVEDQAKPNADSEGSRTRSGMNPNTIGA
jgi:hypothetical protein